MRYSLSTNWCTRDIESGEEIADLAIALGFDALELGFHTSVNQVSGFKSRLDKIPVESIHAFCPVPISAPQGYPELYSLLEDDENARAIARFHIAKNIEFANEMGASTLVLHAGRVPFQSFFSRDFDTAFIRDLLQNEDCNIASSRYQKVIAKAKKRRRERGRKKLSRFATELAMMIPILERNNVTLAMENMPYFEGFPDENELAILLEQFKGAPIRGWFDTGHHRVREMHGWLSNEECEKFIASDFFVGMHLNDVVAYGDDHLAPGDGKVDFLALATLAKKVKHIVLEPNSNVSRDSLAKGLNYIRNLWR